LARLGNIQQAMGDLNEAIKLDGGLAAAFKERSGLHLQKDDVAKAIEDANRAISLNPRDAEALLLRSRAFAKRGDFTKAHADYREGETIPQGLELIDRPIAQVSGH